MTFRDSHKRGAARLAMIGEHNEAAELAMQPERERFRRLRRQEPTKAIAADQLFQTPLQLAARLAGMVDYPDGCRILEPSAGLGRLYQAIRNKAEACPVTLVEINAECAGELYRRSEYDEQATLIQGDFLHESKRLGEFDRIVMNPPFRRGTDIRHIQRAAGLLAPGGKLVALCAAGPRQHMAFSQDGWTFERLPPNSFRSEGTGVNVAIVQTQRGL